MRAPGEGGVGSGSGGSACAGDTGRPMAEPAPPAAELALRRRLPPRLPRRPGDVYVNMKTDFKAQLSRCQKLLGPAGGCAEICIHGLGLAINRAINIALQLQAAGAGALRLAANTSTVELADGLEPQGDEDGRPPLARARNNSAIHIRVCRASPPP
ncbi:ribonuclease P protein subunit p20 [Chelonia mydas]|uniref:ribonuclease P protein subunit p20 n=2 Tax=Cheloniidae TaxID=8465 RepID=UPI0018A1FCD2|nr:ribonuclease P protein subunit p20 [Chelonia mydas]